MKRLFSISCLIFFLLICVEPAFSDQTERKRLGIVGFQSRAQGVTQYQADIITDVLTTQLANSRTIAILERERLDEIARQQRLDLSGLVSTSTASRVGELAGVQYLLTGSVTEFSVGQKQMNIIVHQTTNEVRVTIDIRLIDTSTGEVRLAISETGTASRTTTSLIDNSGRAIIGESERGGLEASAIADASSRLAHKILALIGDEYPHVISVAADEITIDVGSTMGARKDSLYLVYADGRPLTNIHGVIIARQEIPIAVVKVRNVSTSYSTCTIVEKGGEAKNVRRGDKIRPISSAEARPFAGKLDDVRRPAASNETFEQIFGSGSTVSSTPIAEPVPLAENPTDNRIAEIARVSSATSHSAPVSTQPQQVEPVPSQLGAPAIVPQQPQQQQLRRDFNPNVSEEAKVIETYPITASQAELLIKGHNDAVSRFGRKDYRDAYRRFNRLLDDYNGNYLAAFWAGRTAERLGNKENALRLYNKALEINPNYVPAQSARDELFE